MRRPVVDSSASQDWVAAGLAELAVNGIAGVRVEVLAERMGITKGGFYRRFKDRRELLDAMLQAWSDGRIEAIERHAEAGGATALPRLRAMIRLYTERASAQGMAIELRNPAMGPWRRGGRGRGGQSRRGASAHGGKAVS